MHLTTLLLTVRAEITAAEDRAATLAKAVTERLARGQDSTDAEQALFHQLDQLALLRGHRQALQAMRDYPLAA